MKSLKIGIIIFIVLVSIVAVYNKVQLDKYMKSYRLLKEENSRVLHNLNQIETAIINAQTAAMMHQGKFLEFTGLEKVFPDGQEKDTNSKRPRLVLIFSELSCNVCQDKETQFAVTLATEIGPKSVIAVIHATNRRYVQNFIRLNQVNFPVYFCENKDIFFIENKIVVTPIIFIIDEENRVIAANYPLAGHPEYSEPFHRFCYEYFCN